MPKKLSPASLRPVIGQDGYVKEAIPFTPHKGQREGIKFFLEHSAAGYLADPGVGKTATTLAAFKFLKRKGVARKMLVFAPLKVAHMVWPLEVQKWIDFHHFRVVVLHGPKKDELLQQDADIYVINPEGIDWLLGATVAVNTKGRAVVTVDVQRFKDFGFDTLVLDELSKWKNHASIRHKTLKTVLHTFARRWGLTGSPAANGLMDLFGECYMLDQGRAFGPYITHYRSQYFIPSFSGFGWTLKAGAAEQIYERIRPLVLRHAAADYVDMPELVEVDRVFELPPKIRAQYDALEEDLVMKIKDGVVTAANAAVASQKCRQVTGGAIYLEPEIRAFIDPTLIRKAGKRAWVHLHDEKLDLLGDLIDELQGEPLLVAYDFNHELERLQTRFGTAKYPVPVLGKGTTAHQMAEIEREWNAGRYPLLLGQPQSMGHGLNLQGAAHHVAWFTPTWDYDVYDQLNRRVYRQGNKRKRVFVHRLIAKDTVDRKMMWALNAKKKGQNALFEALKK